MARGLSLAGLTISKQSQELKICRTGQSMKEKQKTAYQYAFTKPPRDIKF